MQYQINISKTFVQKPYLNWETSTEAIPKANTYHFFLFPCTLVSKITWWIIPSRIPKPERHSNVSKFFTLEFPKKTGSSYWVESLLLGLLGLLCHWFHFILDCNAIHFEPRLEGKASNSRCYPRFQLRRKYYVYYHIPSLHNHGSVEKWIPPILASLRVVLDFDDYGSKSNIKALQSTYSFPNLQFSQPFFDTVWSYSANVAAELPRKKPRWNHPKKWNHMLLQQLWIHMTWCITMLSCMDIDIKFLFWMEYLEWLLKSCWQVSMTFYSCLFAFLEDLEAPKMTNYVGLTFSRQLAHRWIVGLHSNMSIPLLPSSYQCNPNFFRRKWNLLIRFIKGFFRDGQGLIRSDGPSKNNAEHGKKDEQCAIATW